MWHNTGKARGNGECWINQGMANAVGSISIVQLQYNLTLEPNTTFANWL